MPPEPDSAYTNVQQRASTTWRIKLTNRFLLCLEIYTVILLLYESLRYYVLYMNTIFKRKSLIDH